MEAISFVGGVVGGLLGSSALFPAVATALRERWLKQVEHRHSTEIEQLRAELNRLQSDRNAHLEHGVHIGKAQYDLEIEAYRELWPALSLVRLRARVILLPDIFVLAKDENDLNRRLRIDGIRDFHAAHNTLVESIERLAPFYPNDIKLAARLVTERDNELTRTFMDATTATVPAEHNVVIQSATDDISVAVGLVEQLIRNRLSELRIVP